jgi:hypothetical protein
MAGRLWQEQPFVPLVGVSQQALLRVPLSMVSRRQQHNDNDENECERMNESPVDEREGAGADTEVCLLTGSATDGQCIKDQHGIKTFRRGCNLIVAVFAFLLVILVTLLLRR